MLRRPDLSTQPAANIQRAGTDQTVKRESMNEDMPDETHHRHGSNFRPEPCGPVRARNAASIAQRNAAVAVARQMECCGALRNGIWLRMRAELCRLWRRRFGWRRNGLNFWLNQSNRSTQGWPPDDQKLARQQTGIVNSKGSSRGRTATAQCSEFSTVPRRALRISLRSRRIL